MRATKHSATKQERPEKVFSTKLAIFYIFSSTTEKVWPAQFELLIKEQQHHIESSWELKKYSKELGYAERVRDIRDVLISSEKARKAGKKLIVNHDTEINFKTLNFIKHSLSLEFKSARSPSCFTF